MSSKYFNKFGSIDTIAHTGHHLCMVGFELDQSLETLTIRDIVSPMDAPDYIPAGSSYMLEHEYLDADQRIAPTLVMRG